MENQRLSNFELCRIVTMLLVMVWHTAFTTFELETTSLYIKTLAGFSVVGVNVFVLITGYFSATPKKTSLFNLFFICFFWMAIGMVVKIILGYPVDWTSLFFITKSNWFVVNYIGLLFFAPILNNFCEAVSKRALWGGDFLC